MIAHFISKQLATTATFFLPFFDKGIIFLNDLQFDVDNVRSYESTKQEGPDTNFLAWTALRSSIINMNSKSPGNLLTVSNFDPMNFEYNAQVFNAYVCSASKFIQMLISIKAKTPNSFKKLIADFKLSDAQKNFCLPYQIASEKYVMINYSK